MRGLDGAGSGSRSAKFLGGFFLASFHMNKGVVGAIMIWMASVS